MTLPPLFFYAMGTMLIVFGAARAIVLGRRHPDRELTEDTPDRARIVSFCRFFTVTLRP